MPSAHTPDSFAQDITYSCVSTPTETRLGAQQVQGLPLPQNAVGPHSDDIGDSGSYATDPARDPDTWNAQLFRSITSTSAAGLPQNQKQASRLGLTSGACFHSMPCC